jgi:hypothetical protein
LDELPRPNKDETPDVYLAWYEDIIVKASEKKITQLMAGKLLSVSAQTVSKHVSKCLALNELNKPFKMHLHGTKPKNLDDEGMAEIMQCLENNYLARDCKGKLALLEVLVIAVNNSRQKRGLDHHKPDWVPSDTYVRELLDAMNVVKRKSCRDNTARADAIRSPKNACSNYVGMKTLVAPEFNDGKDVPACQRWNFDALTVVNKGDEGTCFIPINCQTKDGMRRRQIGIRKAHSEVKIEEKNMSPKEKKESQKVKLEEMLHNAMEENQAYNSEFSDLPSVVTQRNETLPQAGKFTFLTNAGGETGAALCVLADGDMEDDEMNSFVYPNFFAGGLDLLMITCKTRNGNDKMWDYWMNYSLDAIVEHRERRYKAGLNSDYSPYSVLTFDGEQGERKKCFYLKDQK